IFNLIGRLNPHGEPVGPVLDEASSGKSQLFQSGRVYWLPSSNLVNIVPTEFDIHIRENGGVEALGYPIGRSSTVSDAFSVVTTEGRLYWSVQGGTQLIPKGVFADYHVATGGGMGTLGYPLTGIITDEGGGKYQKYQGGY